MKIPRELLRESAVVEDFAGSGAKGPLYTARAASVRCSVQPTSRLESDARGRAVTIEALVSIRPEDGPVAPESRVTVRGVSYRVVASNPYPDDRRPYSYELRLSRFAS